MSDEGAVRHWPKVAGERSDPYGPSADGHRVSKQGRLTDVGTGAPTWAELGESTMERFRASW